MSKKLVLGLGGTVDYEIDWDSQTIEALIADYEISSSELDKRVPIETERDLLLALLAFVRDGAGGERFVASSELVEAFAARFRTRITLGGTCVRAAIGMRVLGITCTLHLVSIDDHVRRLLPEGCDYISSAQRDTTDPHLIVQYAQGARIDSGDVHLVAAHPNRIIFTNDPPNRELVLSTELGAVLRDADVFMVSGFNVIQDAETLAARLQQLLDVMRELPAHAVVFYEDAGYHVPELSSLVREQLVGQVDVHSMNEEEMQAYLGRRVDLLDPDDVRGALDELHRLIPASVLVVHSKYWALALGDRAEEFRTALRGGIVMASTRYLHGDGFSEQDYRAVEALPNHPQGAVVASRLESSPGGRVCAVGALVLETRSPTTIGLGDTFVGGFIAALAL
jgi:ADP-dependent phosphofructokinase/glucokinase